MGLSFSRSFLMAATVGSALIAGSVRLAAAPITGIVNISGSVAVGATTIDFSPSVAPIPAGGNGAAVVSNMGNTGSFATLNNQAAVIRDLDLTVQNVFPPAFSFGSFLLFPTAPTIRFDLTTINPGIFGPGACAAVPASPQNCSPAGSPFNLTNTTTTSSTVSLSVGGTVTNTGTGEVSNFTGLFTAQFPAQNYQQLLVQIQGGNPVSTSYSASFVVTPGPGVPEPTTALLLGSSLLGIGIAGAYRRRRAQ